MTIKQRPRSGPSGPEDGVPAGRARVARLMRASGIQGKRRKAYKVTTESNHALPVVSNVLERNFTTDAPNRVWVGDITYIATLDGWLYLAVLLDLFSRKVVGWAASKLLGSNLTLEALWRAYRLRQPKEGCIFHSDRGSQYAAKEHVGFLKEHNFVISMSRKGDCWDNAVAESFFSTLKLDLLDGMPRLSRQDTIREIEIYIEQFYNRQRLHSTLDYRTPVEYEIIARAA